MNILETTILKEQGFQLVSYDCEFVKMRINLSQSLFLKYQNETLVVIILPLSF